MCRASEVARIVRSNVAAPFGAGGQLASSTREAKGLREPDSQVEDVLDVVVSRLR